ncbi:NAD(P)-binding protein [Delitschia confertaspora ATCC 74209]|uniref:NAD(P)-binding protein n=1 Tax=Delitschia confertaspora ATCC 74209 TaxID=1513339 RepID=A0A9P4JEJ8_9PLEO|nr:NAD(P)-binding protein [Delitschia confertaspora ATCC 74209]
MAAQLLQDKVCAITGGVTGIGRAIALGYLSHGAYVAVNHLGDPKSCEQFQTMLEESGESKKEESGRRIVEVRGDVGDPETGKKLVRECVSRWGGLDVFVSNAGVCEFKEFLEGRSQRERKDEEERKRRKGETMQDRIREKISIPLTTLPRISPDLFTSTVQTNLTGAFYTIQAAAQQMVSQSQSSSPRPHAGSIIGISSISALVGGAQQAHYTPTKAGVLSLIQSCACALGKYGIRCNALLPGTIKTQLNEKDLDDEGKRKYMEGRIPLGRTGETGDMVGPAVFLASGELSGYVTGAQLLVDGGLFVNLQ